MAVHNDLGKKGEQMAVDFLTGKNYQILEKNYRFQKAEIDIIAQKEGILAVVEVKTRSTDYFGDPQDFINQKKIRLLIEAIDHYVVEKDIEVDVRFDVIAIIKKGKSFEIAHLKDAFLHF